MERKGLCITCANDKTYTFPRKFPVLQCEEFDDREPLAEEVQKKTAKCKRV